LDLQQFLLSKYNLLDNETGFGALGPITFLDWNDLYMEVINIFFNTETHCLINFKIDNPEHKYEIEQIVKLNALVKVIVESMESVRRQRFKISQPNQWRGQNSGDLSVKLTWDRSFLSSIFGKTPKKEDVMEDMIELIRKIPTQMGDKHQRKILKDKLLKEYGILDADEIINVFDKLPLNERDATQLDIEISESGSNTLRKIASNVPLWPYMERKLNDIDEARVRTRFSNLCIKHGLPESVGTEFITYLDEFNEDEDLQIKAFETAGVAKDGDKFPRILKFYKENGGTFGGWIKALETLRDDPGEPTKKAFNGQESRVQVLDSIISGTMVSYNEWYKKWENKYKFLPRLVTTFDEFEQAFKTHGISNFTLMKLDQLKDELQRADQIWLFRERFGGYAHVLFYLGKFADQINSSKFYEKPAHYVVHSSSNIGRQLHKGTSKVKKDKLDDVIHENDRCFIVRMQNVSEEQQNLMVKRAEACVDPELDPILFTYNGFSGNCETLVNTFYGCFDDEICSQQGRKALAESSTQNKIANLLVSMTKRGSDEDLRNKIKQRLQEKQLM